MINQGMAGASRTLSCHESARFATQPQSKWHKEAPQDPWHAGLQNGRLHVVLQRRNGDLGSEDLNKRIRQGLAKAAPREDCRIGKDSPQASCHPSQPQIST